MKNTVEILKKLWPRRIRYQLMLGIALALFVLMAFFVYEMIRLEQDFLRKKNEEQVRTLVSNFADNSATLLTRGDSAGLRNLTLSQKNFPYLRYAMILSPQHIVLAHTEPDKTGSRSAAGAGNGIGNTDGPTVVLLNDDMIDMAAPVHNGGNLIGWARVGVGREYISDNLTGITRNGLVYALIALIIGSFFAVLIANMLGGSLYKLMETANSITVGDRNKRNNTFHTFEIDRLSVAFNDMLDQISANEKLLATIQENMPVGVVILDKDGMALSVNSEAKRIWGGMKQLDIKDYGAYKGWFLKTGKRIGAQDWAGVRAIMKGELTMNEEIEIEGFDGSRKIILSSAMPLYDTDGNIFRAIIINVDITDKRNAEHTIVQVTGQIAERVKELDCLYSISELVNIPGKAMEDILQESVRCIPPAYQFPDIAVARIRFDDASYTSEGFVETQWRQGSVINAGGAEIGRVEVFYTSEVLTGEAGPFLKEEQLLLDSIADILGNLAERKKRENELKDSEEKFRSLVEQSLVGVFILDNDRFIYVNPGLEKISGYSKQELEQGMQLDDLIHPDDLDTLNRNYRRRMAGADIDTQYVFRALTRDGDTRHMEAIVSRIIFNGAPAIIGTIVDITDRVEEEKRIGKAVTDAQERERKQIGMELHDNVQQIMVGSLINIDFAKRKLDDKAAMESSLADISRYINDALKELRRLSHQLAPSLNLPGNFSDKLRHLAGTMDRSGGIRISIVAENENKKLNDDIQVALYRIVQEQLSNIFKYAQATEVQITIRQEPGSIRLEVRDNGKGFDPATVKRGIGLENINRRAQALGGTSKIHSGPGNGCELKVELPLPG